MDVELLETEPPEEEKRFFGFNRIDFMMIVFCGIMAAFIFIFFIWFLVKDAK